MLEAGSQTLGLLLSRRNEAVSSGIKSGLSLQSLTGRVEKSVTSAVAQGRVLSRSIGIRGFARELSAIGIELGDTSEIARREMPRDLVRSRTFGKNYAEQWFKRAEGETVAKAARSASAHTLGSAQRIGITESSEAFNSGRSKATDAVPQQTYRNSLLKVWDATLDKNGCPVCSAADGTIVGIKEQFPAGEPGSVHPYCRCNWQVLTFQESGSQGIIVPKQPATVHSIPAAASPLSKLPTVASVNGKLTVDAVTKTWAKSLDGALGNINTDGGAAARSSLREILGRYGYKSHDVNRLGGASLTTEVLDIGGIRHWDGRIVVNPKVVTKSRTALRKMQFGIEPGADESDALRVLLHEELHGASAIEAAVYQGRGLALEEATTELAARRIVTDLTGFKASTAYTDEIAGLRAVVQKQTNIAPEKFDALINDAVVKLKARSTVATDAAQHIDGFVDSLKLTPKQRTAIRAELNSTEWWKPDVVNATAPAKVKVAKVAKAATEPKPKAKPRSPPKPKVVPAVKAAEIEAKRVAKAAERKAAAEAKKAARSAKVPKAKPIRVAKPKVEKPKVVNSKSGKTKVPPSKMKLGDSPLTERIDEIILGLNDPKNHGANVRRGFQEHIERKIPGAVQKDVLEGKIGAFQIGADESTLTSMGFDAAHDPLTGAVIAQQRFLDTAARGFGRIAAGEPLTLAQDDAIRLLMHEELHGFSRASASTTFGVARILEEVGTELNARRLSSSFLQRESLSKTYDKDIVAVREAIRSALPGRKLSNVEIEDMFTDAHASQVLNGGPEFSTPQDHIDTLLSGFPVTEQERGTIQAALKRLDAVDLDD